VSSRLVVSLSGINARTLAPATGLAAELDARGVPLSLLVAPRVDRQAADSPALRWVRGRAAGGDALVLHGLDHDLDPCRRPRVIRRQAEFAALPAHEANLRLVAARALLERLDLHTDYFAPPRWLASNGTLIALRRHGFRLCADVTAVRDLRTGAVFPGRVHGLARTERGEQWLCWALVLGVSRSARRGGLVRIAVNAGDLHRAGPRQAVLDAVDIALHHGAEPVTYGGLQLRRLAVS
jgi:predicted deacetylase